MLDQTCTQPIYWQRFSPDHSQGQTLMEPLVLPRVTRPLKKGQWTCHTCSGVMKRSKGDIDPGCNTFRGAKLRSECYVLVTTCQRMLIIIIYKISNVIAKSYQDHQGLQSKQLWTLVTFQGRVSVSSNKRLLFVCLTAVSQCFQIARVANFPTSLSFYIVGVTMRWESNVHSACRLPAHAFRTAIKLTQCCYQGCA